ncbi:NUDIX hydrolase [Herbihabitans rhizosphaerae]|nr:NUDIX hydrolase [Herbihabitans rhizosphaerae]
MPNYSRGGNAVPRTRLEQLIRERQQTFEEFVAYAENYAREHGETGTLSHRHLQRLVSGRHPKGNQIPNVRPATARLLERILGTSIRELLGPPTASVETPRMLTVAVAIVLQGSEVLLVRRRGTANSGGLTWQFPAGIVKPGHVKETTAVDETFKETGVHCVVVCELGARLHPKTNVFCHYFLCDYIGGTATNVDPDENDAVTWIAGRKLERLIPQEDVYPPIHDAIGKAVRLTTTD